MSLKAFAAAQYAGVKSNTACLILIFLNEVDGNPGMTKLAMMCRVSTAAMTGQIDQLTEQGFLYRDRNPDDRRKYIIRLTEKGERLADILNPETPCDDTTTISGPGITASLSDADTAAASIISEAPPSHGH